MQKTMRVMTWALVLGAGMLLAAPSHAKHAKHHAMPQAAPSMGSGTLVPDENCTDKQNRAIVKCGKDKKCIAKAEKMRRECPMVYQPAQQPHMMPGGPMGMGQPMAVKPYYEPPSGEARMGMMPADEGVLTRTAPQPTGKSTGVKLPDANYQPPWLR